MTKCLKCGGTHIVSGKIKHTRDSGFVDAYFMPGHLRFLAATFGRGARIESESYACLDCGLVSSQTDPKAVIDFIRTYRKPSDDSDLPSEST